MPTLISKTRAQGASVVTTLPAEVARRLAISPGQDLADLAASCLVGFARSRDSTMGTSAQALLVRVSSSR